MPQITIDEDTHQRLTLAAKVAGVSIAEVVKILTHADQASSTDESEATRSPWAPVFSNYLGSRVTGEFNRTTGEIRITSGKLEGEEYSAPSSAAIAVVRSENPNRDEPHTNGWRFWKDEKTRRSLDVVYKRPN